MAQANSMARRPLIAANWKMYKTASETASFLKELLTKLPDPLPCNVVICPPFTALPAAAEILRSSKVEWGAQNLSDSLEGAYTGEVAAPMLLDLGCRYVIIGHSERRQYFGETDALVNKKIGVALEQGLTPIVCVGETLKEREAGQTLAVVGRQVRAALDTLPSADTKKTILAYEPIWAIGTGKTASPTQAQEVHLVIRDILKDQYGSLTSLAVRILYGGSIKSENIDDLMACEDIDGGLVGGASLKMDSLIRIINFQTQTSVANKSTVVSS